MVILRLESGEVFTSVTKINEIIYPNEVGTFEIPNQIKNWASKPLDRETAQLLYAYVPESLVEYCTQKKVLQTHAWSIWKESDEQLKKRIEESGKPHLDYGREVHVCFAGSLIFQWDLNNRQLALIVQEGTWIFIEKNIPIWAKPTADYFFTFASYHEDPRDQSQKNYITCFEKSIL